MTWDNTRLAPTPSFTSTTLSTTQRGAATSSLPAEEAQAARMTSSSQTSGPGHCVESHVANPNLCNDMHDCPVSTGDTYLSKLVPKILASKLFTHQKAALFVTFDEGNTAFPRDYVYSVWAGPVVKTNLVSALQHSHYSLLSTLEEVWNLHPLTGNDSAAHPMTEFFVVSHHHRQDGALESRDGLRSEADKKPSEHHELQLFEGS